MCKVTLQFVTTLCIHMDPNTSSLDCTTGVPMTRRSLATVQDAMCTPSLTNQALEIFEQEVTFQLEFNAVSTC